MTYDWYRLLLLPSNFYTLCSIILLGIFTVHRNDFYRLALWLGFTIISACYIKSLFDIPLNALFSKAGWSYPSGHTLSSLMTYFWLVGTFYVPTGKPLWKPITCLSGLIISLLIGMRHFHYHLPVDVLAAVPFAAGFALVSHFWHKLTKNSPLWLTTIVPLMILETMLVLYLKKYNVWPIHLQIIGFSGGLALATTLPPAATLALAALCISATFYTEQLHLSLIMSGAAIATMTYWLTSFRFHRKL